MFYGVCNSSEAIPITRTPDFDLQALKVHFSSLFPFNNLAGVGYLAIKLKSCHVI